MQQSCDGDALGGEPLDAVSRIDLYLRLYACIGVSSYACDTARARMQSTTNAIGSDEFVEQREAFSTRMHPLTLFFTRLSHFLPPLLSNLLSRRYFFSSPPFVFCSFLASCLSTHVKCLVKCSAKSLPNISSFSFLFLVQLFPFVFTFIKIPCSPTWYIEVRSEIELLVAHGMTWNIFSGMHTRNPCVFHLYRVSFRFPRSQQIEHFILLKTLSTLFFALIFCLLYSCFIPSFFYWISKRCSTTTHFLFLRHGPATSIVGKRRVRLFARILERAIRECERSGAADNPERSESRGQEEGYLTTKSFCLMSVDDAVWNILKECRKSIREVDTTGKRVNREVKGEIRVDTLGRRVGGRSKCNQATHFSRREA